MIRIACFPYQNIRPLYDAFDGQAVWVWHIPRQLVAYILQSPVELACIPTAAIPRVRHQYMPWIQLGLAATGPVRSVLLCSRVPVQRLLHRRIWITPESVTSVALLTILLRHVWNVDTWQWADHPQRADAALLIGDTALFVATRRGMLPGREAYRAVPADGYRWDRVFPPELWPYIYDLGAAWYRWQGLPFVYAVWVVRNDWKGRERTDWIRRWTRHVMARQAVLHPTGAWGPPTDAYLHQFRYVLTAADRRALHVFLAYLHADCTGIGTGNGTRGYDVYTDMRLRS